MDCHWLILAMNYLPIKLNAETFQIHTTNLKFSKKNLTGFDSYC